MQLSELGLTQTEYFRLQLRDDRDVLLLVFSHLEEPVGRFSLQQTATKIGASSVLMNTAPRSYYAEGVPGLGDGMDATVAGLRRIIEAVQPRAVVTLGISMGGYAALLFGALLQADRVLAFSPETRLLLPGSRSSFALRRRALPEHLDVLPLLQAAPRTRVALYFGEAELHDVHAAWRLRDLPGSDLYSVQGGGHEIARWFSERGLLQAMIDDFVHHDRTREDFPQRGRILEDGEAIESAMAAQELLLAGEPLRAMGASRGALLAAPHLGLAYDLLGRAATAAGRLRDAVEAHRAAARMTPESPLYRLRYGRALLDAGELAEAETVLRAVGEECPKWAVVHQALASVAEKRGDRARLKQAEHPLTDPAWITPQAALPQAV